MLSVKFICVGRMREKFYIDAFAEYEKRLRTLCRFELTELTEQRLGDNPSSAEISAALVIRSFSCALSEPRFFDR